MHSVQNNRVTWQFPASSSADLSDIAWPSCSGFPAYVADRFCPVFANGVVTDARKNSSARQYVRSGTGFFASQSESPVAAADPPKWSAGTFLAMLWPVASAVSARLGRPDRKSTRLNSSHVKISYA